MTPALGMFEAGLLRSKSTVSMLMQCWAGLCVLSIQVSVMRAMPLPPQPLPSLTSFFQWYVVGYTLSLAPTFHGLIGGLDNLFYLNIPHLVPVAHAPTIPGVIYATFEVHRVLVVPEELVLLVLLVLLRLLLVLLRLLTSLLQMMFAVISPLLITGAFAERVKFGRFLGFISLWSLLVRTNPAVL